jgi:hypothetical protein
MANPHDRRIVDYVTFGVAALLFWVWMALTGFAIVQLLIFGGMLGIYFCVLSVVRRAHRAARTMRPAAVAWGWRYLNNNPALHGTWRGSPFNLEAGTGRYSPYLGGMSGDHSVQHFLYCCTGQAKPTTLCIRNCASRAG